MAPEYGVDLYFLKCSLEDNKEIIELETIEMQYDVLSGYSMETQVQMLEGTIEGFEDIGSSLNQLGYSWIHNDTDGLVDQLSEGLGSFDAEYQQKLNDNRNVNMANKLDEILQRDDGQTYFVIIGSAHVVIDPSVPSELEEKGYKIERIY
ncbi:TraB family protein [Saliterribacillus persicus]|uniref:TraB family protein n=1 Tax=Saliterribacillus persicus TaxID=930114 RepID=A0A368X5R8_9BACI|nr:TraB family protein [Saliterribacillus persicus]